MMKYILPAVLLITGVLYAGRAPVIDYDFSKKTDIRLYEGAVQKDGALHFNGKKSYAIILGSGKLNAGPNGLSIVCTVKFNDREGKGQDVVGKKSAVIFSRNDAGQLFCGFNDSKKWHIGRAGELVPFGKWVQYAMVIERIPQTSWGQVPGYRVNMYLNGEMIGHLFSKDITPVVNANDFILGCGEGNDAWAMQGEIADVRIYDYILDEDKVADLAYSNKRLKLKKSDQYEISTGLAALFAGLRKQSISKEGKWVLEALERAALNGADQNQLAALVKCLNNCGKVRTIEKFAESWNKSQKLTKIIVKPGIAALFSYGLDGNHFPLLGLSDLKTEREILAGNGLFWKMELLKGKEFSQLDSSDEDWRRTSEVDSGKIRAFWRNDTAEVRVDLQLTDSRLETAISAKSLRDDTLVFSVTYPCWTVALLDKNSGRMMNTHGEIISNPAVNTFPRYNGAILYPTTGAPMQFITYYDDKGGIYLGVEDPHGGIKQFQIVSRQQSRIEFSSKSPVSYEIGQTGRNQYTQRGVGALELHRGNWYDAAQIYRRFVTAKADWWIQEIPRKDTPQWFHECTLWIRSHLWHTPEKANRQKDWMIYLRNYFELPFGAHLYYWDDQKKGAEFTHFMPLEFFPSFAQELKEVGIYAKPYLNSHLWAVLDGPDCKSDWMFSSHGKNFAVKNPNGSMNYEYYMGPGKTSGPRFQYAVMCPSSKERLDYYLGICDRVISYGVDMLYHDECAGGNKPFTCFEPAHGHLMNDSDNWVRTGYVPALTKLHEKYPEIAHDGESFAEPYLKVMDGFLTWSNPGLPPVARAVYGGRVVFTGNLFSYAWKFDEEADRRFFQIITDQFVKGEQMGWFEPTEIIDFPEKMHYTKQLMHLRLGLLDYFTGGELKVPLKFKGTPKTATYTMDHRGKPKITNTIPMTSVNSIKNDWTLLIMANPTFEKVDFSPIINYPGNILLEFDNNSGESRDIRYSGNYTPDISLNPKGLKLMLIGMEDNTEFRKEAERISELLSRVSGFQPPELEYQAKSNALTAFTGNWIGIKDAKETKWCKRSVKNDFVSWTAQNAEVNYGVVDFGDKPPSRIEIEVLVAPGQKGGKIELRTGEALMDTAVIEISDTNGEYKKFSAPLLRKITGKRQALVRFKESNSCTFKSWRVY